MRISLLGRGQQLFETSNARMPAFFDLRKQGVGTAHGIGIAGHALRATVPPFGHQLSAFQNRDVFLDGCE
jgi:hypothetical protein